MLVAKLGPDLRPDLTCVVRVSKVAPKPTCYVGDSLISLSLFSEDQRISSDI
jgi:hypothetical protein